MSRLAPIDKRIRDLHVPDSQLKEKNVLHRDKWGFEATGQFETFRCIRQVTLKTGEYYQELVLNKGGGAKSMTREQAYQCITFLNKKEAQAS